jgi:AMMECR1 domain-containing protein
MGVETWLIDDMPLDHGALVPLWHLREAGWGGATLVVGLPVAQSANPALLGRALAAAVREEGGRVAVIASGDMSHRLAANGPNGQDPDAAEFEAKFLSIVRRGEYRELEGLDRGLRVVAAEDAVDSMIAASAAVGWASENRELLSYEAPYGVGYAIAVLHYPRRGAAVAAPGVQPLPAVARQAIADEVRGRGGGPPPPLDPALAKRHGVFVTLIGPSGAVRGCMGTIEPTQPDTVAETWANARAAAFKDPRFPPVRADDLGTLRLEVNVIGEMEPVASEHLLDPERFGVNVRALDGRCATVLPGVPSIRSGGDQIAVARRRAGIAPGEPIAMFRFAVERHEEVPGGAGGGA